MYALSVMPKHFHFYRSPYLWRELLTSNGDEVRALSGVLGLNLEAGIVANELVGVRIGDHLVTGENVFPNLHFS